MNNKKKTLILSILGILSLVVITIGVTYAFFTYAREGTTENSITTGSITFIYNEIEAQGAGISISDAYPTSDEVGKAQTGDNKVFNFKVTSTTGNSSINYEVTARKKDTSTLDESAVKVYLTEVVGDAETEILLDKYSNLEQTSVSVPEGTVEKTIYTGTVDANSNYEKNFRLRMWLSDDVDFSNGDMNDKTFTLTVNVYANAEVVSVPETYAAYAIGDAITLLDGSKWHVLEDSDENSDTVVLLSDYNLNSDGSYNTECGRDINSTYTCSTIAFDSDNTNTYDETDSNNIGYFIKNTYEPLVISALPGTTNVTLPTSEQIAIADNQIFNKELLSLTNSWLLTTNYWTKISSDLSDYGVWLVDSNTKRLTYGSASLSYLSGARPVITTLKSNIVKTMTSETALSIGDSVTATDGSRWHVLEASDATTETVVLLSDYNLNTDGSYNTECGGKINSTYACSPMVFDTDNTNTYDETDSNNIGYFIKNTYEPLVITSLPETTDITIPTAAQIALADSQTFNQSLLTLTSSWLSLTNYWTKTYFTSNSNLVWYVSGARSYLDNYYAYDDLSNIGARPVITTLKSNLLAE